MTTSRIFIAGRALLCCLLPSALGGVLVRFERLADTEAAGLLARREFLEGLEELIRTRVVLPLSRSACLSESE
jgi:hypothetical protein